MAKKPTAGIILAAGMSTRFGQLKQLLKVGDSTILSMVINATLKSDLDKVVLVLGHQSESIRACLAQTLSDSRLRMVVNPLYQEGMSTSLQRGLSEVKDEFQSIMIFMGDQPLLTSETINTILRRFRASDKDICVPVHEGKRGLPVCFSRRFYDEILEVRGDQGAREVIRNNPKDVLAIEINEPDCFLDIDNAGDFERLQLLLKE
jgi:molybdenum cofactor cytidylyltransferase